MVSRQDNEALTRVGPDDLMGKFIRRFWIPAALSSEVAEPDCDPIRLRLLGEDLILFRDTAGQVGLLEERRPHRLASLFYGRNEQGGIRCIYHGWKYRVDGQCVEQPNEAPERCFADRIKAVAYPVIERGGVIWTHMGDPADQPQFPEFEWLDLPDANRYASRWRQDCNFVQALEGELDSSHVSFLHRRIDQLADSGFALTGAYFQDGHPHWEIDDTEYGYVAAARRTVEDNKWYWRMNQFLLPFYTMITPAPGDARLMRAWIPRDDESCWVICVTFRPDEAVSANELAAWKAGEMAHRDTIAGTTDPVAHAGNDYLLDRHKQRTESFTGIPGIRNQDAVVTESAGAIVDRSKEHLGMADLGVVALRRRLLNEARDADRGGAPKAVQDGGLYRVRAHYGLVDQGVSYKKDEALLASLRAPPA